MTGVGDREGHRTLLGDYLPAIVLTGDTSREGIAEIAASGFQILHKPISPEPLRRCLAWLMSG